MVVHLTADLAAGARRRVLLHALAFIAAGEYNPVP